MERSQVEEIREALDREDDAYWKREVAAWKRTLTDIRALPAVERT
jgi:hypothetical protein